MIERLKTPTRNFELQKTAACYQLNGDGAIPFIPCQTLVRKRGYINTFLTLAQKRKPITLISIRQENSTHTNSK